MTLEFNIKELNYTKEQGGGSITPEGTKVITENGLYNVTTFAKASVNVEGTTPTGTTTITENGTYDVTEYASASVNVEGTEPTLITKTITVNGTYSAEDDDADGYSDVSINVSGGGGSTQVVRGAWVVPQCVLDLEEAFENYTATGTYNYVCGILLYKGVGSVTIVAEQDSRLVTSDGLDVSFGDTYSTITFNDKDADNWLIFQTNLAFWSGSPIKPYGISTNSLKRGCFRYAILEDINKTGQSMSKAMFCDFALESIKLKNISYGSEFKGDDLQSTSCQYMPPMTYWSANVPSSNIVTKFTEAHKLPNLPYGLDLSSITSNLTLGVSNCGMNRIREAYIKLPNANFIINSSSGIVFTEDNWQYIADNAPTVSGKTLTMGNMNIEICGGTSGTIISTLTNKGWTVN